MSRIKGTVIKRATKELLKKYPSRFTANFTENKRILGKLTEQKKIRNSIAGYLARLVKKQQSEMTHVPIKTTKTEVSETNGQKQ